jgi:hypothetical protein
MVPQHRRKQGESHHKYLAESNLADLTEHAYGHDMGKGEINFTRQYQPVNFGDRPSTKAVDSRRIAAIRAAEERRFEQIVRERIEEEFDSRWRRLMRHVVWFLSHLKFRGSLDGRSTENR